MRMIFIVTKDKNDYIYYSIYGEKIQYLVIIFGKYLFETGLTNWESMLK